MPAKSKKEKFVPVQMQFPSVPSPFRINSDLKVAGHDANYEGVTSGGGLIRVKRYDTVSNDCERYLRQFKCLTPNGQRSRLYVIPIDELVRQNEKGKAVQAAPKQIKRKR